MGAAILLDVLFGSEPAPRTVNCCAAIPIDVLFGSETSPRTVDHCAAIPLYVLSGPGPAPATSATASVNDTKTASTVEPKIVTNSFGADEPEPEHAVNYDDNGLFDSEVECDLPRRRTQRGRLARVARRRPLQLPPPRHRLMCCTAGAQLLRSRPQCTAEAHAARCLVPRHRRRGTPAYKVNNFEAHIAPEPDGETEISAHER